MMQILVPVISGIFGICAIIIAAGLKLVYDLRVERLKKIHQEELEKIKFQLVAEKDRTHYKYTKYFDLQVTAFSELSRLEVGINEKLYLYALQWEFYFFKLFIEDDHATKESDEDYREIELRYNEFNSGFQSRKIYLSEEMEKIYDEILRLYKRTIVAIDDYSLKAERIILCQLPYSLEAERIDHQNFYTNIVNTFDTELISLKNRLKLEIQKFINI